VLLQLQNKRPCGLCIVLCPFSGLLWCLELTLYPGRWHSKGMLVSRLLSNQSGISLLSSSTNLPYRYTIQTGQKAMRSLWHSTGSTVVHDLYFPLSLLSIIYFPSYCLLHRCTMCPGIKTGVTFKRKCPWQRSSAKQVQAIINWQSYSVDSQPLRGAQKADNISNF